MNLRVAATFAAFVLASGCATGRAIPASVTGNAEFVSVSNVWGVKDALPYAEKHCSAYGKTAKLKQQEGYAVSFDCV
jgi:hypothetical protein